MYEDYVWVSLGNAMKAKQSKAKGCMHITEDALRDSRSSLLRCTSGWGSTTHTGNLGPCNTHLMLHASLHSRTGDAPPRMYVFRQGLGPLGPLGRSCQPEEPLHTHCPGDDGGGVYGPGAARPHKPHAPLGAAYHLRWLSTQSSLTLQ